MEESKPALLKDQTTGRQQVIHKSERVDPKLVLLMVLLFRGG